MRTFGLLTLMAAGTLTLMACGNEASLGNIPTDPDLPGTDDPTDPTDDTDTPPPPDPDGPSPLRDTDGDGIPDDRDGDLDGDGLLNDVDPDPDGDGQPGYTLPYDPADDPPIDPSTGLPILEEGSARGRVCAPNGTTWVAGAEISVLTPSGAYTATSNGDGWWQVDGLPPGTYGVVVTKGSFYLQYNVTILDGQVTETIYDECLSQGDLTIAVVTGAWDHVEDVLEPLGLVVTEYDGDILGGSTQDATVTNLLTNPTLLAQYDVVFLNCGISEDWVDTNETLVAQTLRDYVEAGGSIYASDWSYYTIEAAFPEKITFFGNDSDDNLYDARVGLPGPVQGIVADPAMALLLGSNQADVQYDLNNWVVMSSHDPTVENMVEGDYSYSGGSATGPLSVRFSAGAGRVIYTTFHNEGGATTPDMRKMLEEIALSL
ncbi:MAG: carboxypeptidase regulatory-like domain-containing protein [Alphaproteobacteria bacterium]|nr:carboxypeptidase regulatory-like domain-containing protein [Alphaproteobacteria bacterium]MCB9693380.1 carboxypeptidase regulatory-like domain-containing protein [Alphaproteobacteria bacterium]